MTNIKVPKPQASVIEIKKENISEYKRLHANIWPDVSKMVKECNIPRYSIYLGEVKKNEFYLFGYYEYLGKDLNADMAKMAADPVTQQWWKHTDPLQIPLATRKEGEWWACWDNIGHLTSEKTGVNFRRYGSVMGIKKENIFKYKRLYEKISPYISKIMTPSNIRRNSLFAGSVEKDRYYLFNCFDYVGEHFEEDMAKIEADPEIRQWRASVRSYEVPVPTRKESEWWHFMEEVWRLD